MNVAPPPDPIAAVTHPDPYPYYADLVSRRPLYRDDALGLWVASSASAVTAVLTSERCRVRPPAEPVPSALLGSAAGEIFRHLVRMNDGARHARLKPAVSAALASTSQTRVADEARRWAAALAPAAAESGRISDLAFRLPVHVVAGLLGIADDLLDEMTTLVRDFVRCLAPGVTPEDLKRGAAAAERLLDVFSASLDQRARRPETLLAGLAARAPGAGGEDVAAVIANGIGFLSQAYEATAGLIGNALVAGARHPGLLDQVRHGPEIQRQVLAEVLRHDAPVQNTRRFVVDEGIVAGVPMKAGEAILVVLAAANRDPAANPAPEAFDPFRTDRRTFTFGVGAHACPGEALAVTIAGAAVEQLVARGVEPRRLVETLRYRPSVNTRVPLFEGAR